ncbi:MAG: hypothetical protein KGJ70_02955 [Gemmatimonadota bacterium]|nr:hypothetical protein [Gemmatimonadota bacterium]
MKSSASLRTIAIAFGLLVATTAQGQRPQSSSQVVPPNLRPPAGMCRVWVNGVPPERQPAPTDCASALRNRPANGRVIFGDDFAPSKADDVRPDDQPLKGLAPLPKSLEPKPADARKPEEPARRKAEPRKSGGHKPDSTAVNPADGGPASPGA